LCKDYKIYSLRSKAEESSQPAMASSAKRPSSMRAGDTVWIIPGVNVPMVLRNGENGGTLVYDNMDGKALREWTFVLERDYSAMSFSN
jgi:hypothetical protein